MRSIPCIVCLAMRGNHKHVTDGQTDRRKKVPSELHWRKTKIVHARWANIHLKPLLDMVLHILASKHDYRNRSTLKYPCVWHFCKGKYNCQVLTAHFNGSRGVHIFLMTYLKSCPPCKCFLYQESITSWNVLTKLHWYTCMVICLKWSPKMRPLLCDPICFCHVSRLVTNTVAITMTS